MRRGMVLLLCTFGVMVAGCGGSSEEAAPPPAATPTAVAEVDEYPQLDMTSESLSALVEVFRLRFPALSVARTDNEIVLAFQNTCTAIKSGSTPGSAVVPMFLSFKADKVQPTDEVPGLSSLAVTRVCPNYRG
ncbi:hypothetical protein [Rhodococcus sp. X156]|uniref:hypothetical protein n=1 Tax=Rhodococcus sp. X156 TaxID=2499145 RepID=UPI0013E360FF|nr:hypothetical protein [Rhodococcus sp. X156]